MGRAQQGRRGKKLGKSRTVESADERDAAAERQTRDRCSVFGFRKDPDDRKHPCRERTTGCCRHSRLRFAERCRRQAVSQSTVKREVDLRRSKRRDDLDGSWKDQKRLAVFFNSRYRLG